MSVAAAPCERFGMSSPAVPTTGTAVQMDRYGGPEVLVARETPTIALRPGEIRIRTVAAAVNRADLEIRSGNPGDQRASLFMFGGYD
jgi:NADPH:quinone reductase-like Zn-dependent oxidoreductase